MDSLFGGRLLVCQQRDGYRFSIDAVLLAGLSRIQPLDRVADLGTGCGVIPLILGFRRLGSEIVGFEIQPELVELAYGNVEINKLDDKVKIIEMDFRKIGLSFPPESFDVVTCNPPYREVDSGRVNPNLQKALARHEISCTLRDVFSAAHYLLRHQGKLMVIYPATRLDHLLTVARDYQFSAKKLTLIYSRPGSSARLVHLECRKGGGEELQIEPPFFIYDDGGEYTAAMRRLFDD